MGPGDGPYGRAKPRARHADFSGSYGRKTAKHLSELKMYDST